MENNESKTGQPCQYMLTQDEIGGFQRLYQKHYGTDISESEANRQGISLILLLREMTLTEKEGN